MDNRNSRAPKLFGTPLSKCLEDRNDAQDVGPVNRRRSRLERHQIVQDDQGRRRFHGAFTGGFSAGYYNTVDSVQGFQPKSFSSHRGVRQQDEGSSFEHRPEDYMDEEDFGEFGIAPKKIRLACQFSEEKPTHKGLTVNDSVGEKILRCMTRNRRVHTLELDKPIRQKNDYHGLGYKPLNARGTSDSCSSALKNPLTATLKSGVQLKIAGEAFGVGVFDVDEDLLHGTNEYGYDDISNYNFSQDKSQTKELKYDKKRSEPSKHSDSSDDSHRIPGFILAHDLAAMQLCDNECLNYPLPIIDDRWKMPVRTEPLIKPQDESDLNRKYIDLYKSRVNSFNDKFTRSESGPSRSASDIESRSGLVPYSDLKALTTTDKPKEVIQESHTNKGISIIRKVVDWRPCSLLCKHFGVDNPYPDNKFFGVNPSDLRKSDENNFDLQETYGNNREEPAPMEMRKSIFNVRFDKDSEDDANYDLPNEYEPQVIDLETFRSHSEPDEDQQLNKETSEEVAEPEVLVVDVPIKEPEVIVLSSSEESKSVESISGDDDDAYGPPLPPSRLTLRTPDGHSVRQDYSDPHGSTKMVGKTHKRKRHKHRSHRG